MARVFPLKCFYVWPAVLMLALSLRLAASQDNLSDEFFEKKIRPVLADKCLTCHGDLASGGLRLDSREAILKGGALGAAIVPGDPASSLLMQAVRHTHARLKMPMGGQKLRQQEIRNLALWIDRGAPWPESAQAIKPKPAGPGFVVTGEQRAHWALQPRYKPGRPEVHDRSWPHSPIDTFVLARLEAEGLRPVRPADKRTLIRRAYLDLTGLPPAPPAIEAFVQDPSSDAFAKIVDQLLQSPRYGERWGRYWLDVARYAEDDVRGTSQESYENAWRYRDWVIQSLNEDLPYDLFVKAQLAGDLVEGDRHKTLGGLGFLGLGPWYYDIAEPPQARADERDDRVDAVGRAFLGLTVACARCHDHKYDPISMQDYYALAGVFASTNYWEYSLVPDEVVTAYRQHQKKIKELEGAIQEFRKSQSRQLSEILARKAARYLVAAWKVRQMPGVSPRVMAQREGLDRETLERWLKHLDNSEKDYPYLNEWNRLLREGGDLKEVRRVADVFQAALLAVIAEKKAADEENRLLLAQAEPKKDAGMTMFLPNGFATYADYCPGCRVVKKAITREKFLFWRDLMDGEGRKSNDRKTGGILYYSGEKLERFLAPEWKDHLDSMRKELEALKKAAPPPYPYLHGASDSRDPSNLQIHLRGSPYNLGEEVPRRFLEVLSEGEPALYREGSGRLELAEAIARHPLAIRVMVNRVWRHHFGSGLVRTPSNFGLRGDRPSHPQLLEYLANRLIENNGSLKALHREIMLSATYQLSSEFVRENFEKDPKNRLLWRANRRRLDIEAVRDSLLYVAGSLDLMAGGSSAPLDDDNVRRTVYGRVSRFRLNRLLALFDFPSPISSIEKRNVTNVPLQWLFFMNSTLVWREADRLAQRIHAEGGPNDEPRIRHAYRLIYGREATEREVELGLDFLREARPESSTQPPAWQQYAQVLLSSNEFLFVN